MVGLTSLKMMEVMLLAKKKLMSELTAPFEDLSAGVGESPCDRYEGSTE